MNIYVRLLSLLLVAEILLAAVLILQKTQRTEPPLPDFGKVDAETAQGLMELR